MTIALYVISRNHRNALFNLLRSEYEDAIGQRNHGRWIPVKGDRISADNEGNIVAGADHFTGKNIAEIGDDEVSAHSTEIAVQARNGKSMQNIHRNTKTPMR